MAIIQWFRDAALYHLQTTLPSLLFLLALLLWSLRRHGSRVGQGSKLPPGPAKLPIIGNLHQLGHLPHLSLHKLALKFGPIVHLRLGQIPTVVISSARLAKEVLKTHDLALSNRPRLYSAKHLTYDFHDITFAPYGPYWRHARKICTLELFSARRVQSYTPVRYAEARRLVQGIGSCYPGTVDLTQKLGLYANDLLCRVALGRNFSQGGEYGRHGFQSMLDENQVLLGGFSVGDFFPSMEWIDSLTGMKQRLLKTFSRFDRFFDEVIAEHLNPQRGEVVQKDLVDVLLDIHKNGGFDMPLTIDNIKAIILEMFTAGTDTTFVTLDWGMTELIMNPSVLKRAAAEVRSVVGEKQWVIESDLPQMHYLRAVLKEIFRLHPPAPVLVPRESVEDIVIDGYEIPAKTRFYVNAWAIGRDPDLWEKPECFEPERFLNSSIDYRGKDFELIPFGAGRRSCPAINFGTASLEIALAQLLHSFDWELPPGVEAKDLDMTEEFGITMHRIEHLNVVARPRFQ